MSIQWWRVKVRVRRRRRGRGRRGSRWRYRVLRVMMMVVVMRGLVGIFRRLRRVATESRIVQTAVRMRKLGMRWGGGWDARMSRQASVMRVMVALRVKVSRVSPDVVPVSLQKAQLRVVEDVEVGAAQTVARCPNKEVAVVFARLPPYREVERGPAQLKTGWE